MELKIFDTIVPINISTITVYIQNALPICNILNIGKYIEIDENIIGLKYKRGEYIVKRGIYNKSTTGFNNQISIILCYNNKNFNVKIFKNGSIQITGCKNIGDINTIKNILINKLDKFKNNFDTILLSKDSDSSAFLDNNNLLYNKDGKIFGYKHNEQPLYTLIPLNTDIQNYYKFDKNIDKFLLNSKNSSKYKKDIVNNNGYFIGHKCINMNKYCKRFFNNPNIIIEESFIYYNNKIIGNIEYKINNLLTEYSTDSNYYELEYSCNPFISKNSKKECINMCINISFDINFNINLDNAIIKLQKLNFNARKSYHYIKLIYICNCKSICSCNKKTFLIFKTGKIIGSGFKDYTDISNSVQKIIHFFHTNPSTAQGL